MNKVILKEVLKNKSGVVVLFVFCFFACVAELMIPYFTKQFIDEISQSRNLVKLQHYFLFFLCSGVVALLSNYLISIFSAKLVNTSIQKVLLMVVKHIIHAPLEYFRKYNSAELARRIDNDTCDVVCFLICNLPTAISGILNFIGVIFLVSQISYVWVYVLISLIGLYAFFLSYVKNYVREIYRRYRDSTNEYFGVIDNMVEDIKFLKIHVLYDFFLGRLSEKLVKFAAINIRRAKLSFYFGNNRLFLELLFYIILFSKGILQVIQNEITMGDFVALIGYFNILVTVMSFFVNLTGDYQNVVVASNRLGDLLNAPVEVYGEKRLKKIEIISLKGVEAIVENEKIFEPIDMKFKRGYVYCIEGENGSGKSTFLKILIGVEQHKKGLIMYNSDDISEIDLEYMLKHKVAFVEQENYLIDGSICDNLSMEGIATEGLDKNSYCCLLSQGIKSLDKVFLRNTLSGGERQRIAIFRALLKDADVLLLDEPTSELDKNGIDLLTKILEEIKKEKIIIIVSHDKRILEFADERIRFKRKI